MFQTFSFETYSCVQGNIPYHFRTSAKATLQKGIKDISDVQINK
jgi:hypothetical protein